MFGCFIVEEVLKAEDMQLTLDLQGQAFPLEIALFGHASEPQQNCF